MFNDLNTSKGRISFDARKVFREAVNTKAVDVFNLQKFTKEDLRRFPLIPGVPDFFAAGADGDQ